MLPFKIVITDIHTAKRLAFGDEITRVISIVDSNHNPDHHLGNLHHGRDWWKVFVFDDMERNFAGIRLATMGDIRKILDFTKNLKAGDTILIHCHAGLCRSTAVALLVMMQHGMTAEQALEHLLSIRPKAWPNRHVLRLGDHILDTDSLTVVNGWMSEILTRDMLENQNW